LIFAAIFALTPFPSIAQQTWKLITPDEEARDDVAPKVPALPDRPPPPKIDMIRPDISRPIRNPATIEVGLAPAPANQSTCGPSMRPTGGSPSASRDYMP
jgi:hypothetical protein